MYLPANTRPRDRPEGYQEQKKYYLGKKKNHTLKNQLIVLPNGRDIVDIVAAGAPGSKSDINFFRERQQGFDPTQQFNGDKGYVGEPNIKTPQKKPKKLELTTKQKQQNKELSTERIFVEHIIRLG